MTLDEPGTFEGADPHHARDVLTSFPRQCRGAVRLRAAPTLSVRAPRLVVVGGAPSDSSTRKGMPQFRHTLLVAELALPQSGQRMNMVAMTSDRRMPESSPREN